MNLGNAADSNDSEWRFYISKHFVFPGMSGKEIFVKLEINSSDIHGALKTSITVLMAW